MVSSGCSLLACEQALLFGQAKLASRGFAAHSCVLARLTSLAQMGEFARRLVHYYQEAPLCNNYYTPFPNFLR